MELKQDSRILYCKCAWSPTVPGEVKRGVGQALREAGVAHTAVADLCELAARKSPLLAELAAARELTVIACHPRAVEWLFAAGGAPVAKDRVRYFDMRASSAAGIIEALGVHAAEARTAIESDEDDAPEKMPWFPVIDYARCDDCQLCLGFCLFGVYEVDGDGKVRASHPDNCKTGCPACARVCPLAAIIFPKYATGPINGSEEASGEPMQLDKAALLNGDILKTLQDRGKGGLRFAAQPEQVKAVRERLAHLGVAAAKEPQ